MALKRQTTVRPDAEHPGPSSTTPDKRETPVGSEKVRVGVPAKVPLFFTVATYVNGCPTLVGRDETPRLTAMSG